MTIRNYHEEELTDDHSYQRGFREGLHAGIARGRDQGYIEGYGEGCGEGYLAACEEFTPTGGGNKSAIALYASCLLGTILLLSMAFLWFTVR